MVAARTLPASLDVERLAAVPGLRHWFRYPLHDGDFRALRANAGAHGRLLGYYAAKPLYGKLTPRGRVDRRSGYNGDVAAVFVPSPARSWKHARVLKTHLPARRITRADGRRNWPAIRAGVEAMLRRAVA